MVPGGLNFDNAEGKFFQRETLFCNVSVDIDRRSGPLNVLSYLFYGLNNNFHYCSFTFTVADPLVYGLHVQFLPYIDFNALFSDFFLSQTSTY